MEYGSSREERLNVIEMRCLRSRCRVMSIYQVRNVEVRRRSGVTRVEWSRRAECVEVVWTHGENGGGLFGEEYNRI